MSFCIYTAPSTLKPHVQPNPHMHRRYAHALILSQADTFWRRGVAFSFSHLCMSLLLCLPSAFFLPSLLPNLLPPLLFVSPLSMPVFVSPLTSPPLTNVIPVFHFISACCSSLLLSVSKSIRVFLFVCLNVKYYANMIFF